MRGQEADCGSSGLDRSGGGLGQGDVDCKVPTASGPTRTFRFGNHPVRMMELEREFGACHLRYLFNNREAASSMAVLLDKA